MEPNKIEKQFREKLNAREIQPSAPAWDRLDAMLSVAEEKKTKRSFGWLYIAASVLVLVSLGMFFFMQNSTVIEPQNMVVGTESKKDTIQNPATAIQNPVAPEQLEKQVVVSEQPAVNQEAPITNHHQIPTNHQAVSINNQKTTTNPINKDKEIVYQNSSDVALKDLPKVMDAQETVVKKETSAKSDESLLADLDNAAKQSAGKKSTIKMDAKSLLSQVDGELELTFREKVINKVNKNYQEVKVALANRNNK